MLEGDNDLYTCHTFFLASTSACILVGHDMGQNEKVQKNEHSFHCCCCHSCIPDLQSTVITSYSAYSINIKNDNHQGLTNDTCSSVVGAADECAWNGIISWPHRQHCLVCRVTKLIHNTNGTQGLMHGRCSPVVVDS